MGLLRPVAMRKVGLVGLKDDRPAILTTLHDLGVAQVEPISQDALQYLAPERASESQRAIGEELLRFRGLKNALPRVPAGRPRQFASLEEVQKTAASVPIDAEVGDLKRTEDRLLTERKALSDQIEVLEKIPFYGDRLAYLHAGSFLTFYGEAEREAYDALRASLPGESDAVFLQSPVDDHVRFLVTVRTEAADSVARLMQARSVRLVAVPPLDGTVTEERARLVAARAVVDGRVTTIRARLLAIAGEWYPTVAAIEEALAIENRKLEVYTKLGVSQSTFALEAWVPVRDLGRLEAAIDRVSYGRAGLYPIVTTEEAPTLMDHPPGIRWFEFFIRFYSLPQAAEWDPTLVYAIVFPIVFGFMLGDWGYGLVILGFCVWMIRGFPGARYLPKSIKNFVKLIMGPNAMRQLAYALLPGCAIAIGLGLYWDAFFGYPIFGVLLGYHPAIQPEANVGLLLLVAGYIGLGMVTLGFLFGALGEYFRGHRRGAIGKTGGILLAWGIALLGLAVIHGVASPSSHPVVDVYLGLVVGGALLLIGGEGLQMGMMGLIEVVSHILSYTRLVGILLASVVLALVINDVAGANLVSHDPVLILFGLVILLVGQTFNLIIGVFEPGIQGARLIFVEYFSKFYHGNGRPFRPFKTERSHTVAASEPFRSG